MCEKKMNQFNPAELTEEQLARINGGSDDLSTTPPPEAVAEGLYLGAIVANDGIGCERCGNNRFRVTGFGTLFFDGTCTNCDTVSFAVYKTYGGDCWSVV